MASSSTIKPWKQQATVLTILVASSLIMGFAPPAAAGSVQAQQPAGNTTASPIQKLTSRGGACDKSSWGQCLGQLRYASTTPKAAVPLGCCQKISRDACGCAVLKNQAALGINLAIACPGGVGYRGNNMYSDPPLELKFHCAAMEWSNKERRRGGREKRRAAAPREDVSAAAAGARRT
ncbi:hypothetical protein ACP70R_021114 [Stipagrostis hirtigluma subsp. patula]